MGRVRYAMEMDTGVIIVARGCSRFGRRTDANWADLIVEALRDLRGDAATEWQNAEAAWVSTYNPDYGWGLGGGALVAAVGLPPLPVTRVENYCASGLDALRNAWLAVRSGAVELALVVGAEKLTDRAGRGLQRLAQHPEYGYGNTAPGFFALGATRYLHTYNVGREALAAVAVKNHAHGAHHPLAHFRKEITMQKALEAAPVADPFCLYDCCPVTDGAAVVVLASEALARSRQWNGARVEAVEVVAGSHRPFATPGFDYLGFTATRLAAQRLWEGAGITDPYHAVDVAEVHDCFTWTEIADCEDLGLAPRGEGWRWALEGISAVDGAMPINPSGGLKSFGHPIGATGVRMVCELTDQLAGEARGVQVQGARRGVAQNVGGPGSVAAVALLTVG